MTREWLSVDISRRTWRGLGTGLQLIAIGYVAYYLFANLPDLLKADVRLRDVLAAGAIVTAIATGSLAIQFFAWVGFLRAAADSSVATRNALWLFGRTMVAKYLPSNSFHYVGRQLLARQIGWSQSVVFVASVAEVTVVVIAACTIALAPLVLVTLPTAVDIVWVVAALLLGIVLPIILIYLARVAGGSGQVVSAFRRIGPGNWLIGYILYLGFMVAATIALAVPVHVFSDGLSSDGMLLIASAYGMSFVLGYITPGAPGGVGIREALLILLLAPEFGSSPVLLAAFLHRAGSIVAEVGLYGLTLAVSLEA